MGSEVTPMTADGPMRTAMLVDGRLMLGDGVEDREGMDAPRRVRLRRAEFGPVDG